MNTMVLFTGDSKLAPQIEFWLRQAMADRLAFEFYRNLDDYKLRLEEANKKSAGAGAGDKDAKKLKVFVIDIDMVGSKPIPWVAELQRITAERGQILLVEGKAPKVLMLAHDGGVTRPEALQHDAIDDLVLKPVDKQLFLQKLEFLAADDGKVNPNFLFRAKTSQIVEVGRDAVIDEISEFAVSIRSPGPLPEGTYAAIHCDLFGTRGARRLIGRVYESVKHASREGEFAVRFSYFGVSAEQLSTIRRYIRSNQAQVSKPKAWGTGGTVTVGGSAAPAKPALSKALQEKMVLLKMRKFAVIDLNPDTLAETKELLETSFKGIIVRPFPSYTRLMTDLRRLLPDAKPNIARQPTTTSSAVLGGDAPQEPAFPLGRRMSAVFRGKSRELARFEPEPRRTDMVIGRTVAEWLDRPDLWTTSVEPDDRDAFEEFMQFAEAGSSGRLNFRMITATGAVVYIEASGVAQKSGLGGEGSSLVKVDMREMDAASWQKANQAAQSQGAGAVKDPSVFRFEAIVIDASFIRPDPAAWYERFVDLLRQCKVLGPEDQPPRIFVLADPKSTMPVDLFRIKNIADFSFKPIDRRFLIQKYHSFFPTLALSREPEQPPFIKCEVAAKMGKEVVMEELSEYGLIISHPSAFKEKSFMRFFSRLFGEEGEWVSGRAHSCEKKTDTDGFRCQFMFFGARDDLLQRIRRWIREDHVKRKDTGKT